VYGLIDKIVFCRHLISMLKMWITVKWSSTLFFPLGAPDSMARLTGAAVPSYLFKVWAQSQSFSRSYGSVLPTSLAYIVPLARGCSPWRPDAVMSTRPYTQIWRSICTSEPLRASTRVSSGFTLFRHSSPSFGSQQLCSYSNPSENIRIGRWCTLRFPPPFTFIPHKGFDTQTLA